MGTYSNRILSAIAITTACAFIALSVELIVMMISFT
jgi:hypothetical protein